MRQRVEIDFTLVKSKFKKSENPEKATFGWQENEQGRYRLSWRMLSEGLECHQRIFRKGLFIVIS